MKYFCFLCSSCILIVSAIAASPLMASDIDVDISSSSEHHSHLANMTARLNLTTLDKENDSSTLPENGLIDIELNESTQLSIGRKKIGHSSLIYIQEYNQGVSSDINLSSLNSRLQTFTSSTQIIEQDALTTLGIEDHSNRANGVIWEYQPVTTGEEQLSFTTSYLSGESEIDNQVGDALSFTTAASAFNQSLQLRGEYAQSSFGAMNGELQNSENAQEAQHYLINYQPFNFDNKNQKWNIGLEKKTIDAQFQPLYNRHLPQDRDITRLFGRYEKTQWSSEASITHEKNNLQNKLDTTDNIRSGTLIGRYRQKSIDYKQSLSLLGQQEYSVQYHQSNKVQRYRVQEHLQKDWQNEADTSNHNRYQTLSLEGRYHYSSWQWFYKGSRSRAIDTIDMNGYFRASEIILGAQFLVGTKTKIDTTIRHVHNRKTVSKLNSSEIHYGLDLQRTLTPNNTSGKLAFHYHQRNTKINMANNERNQTLILSGDISRRLLKSKKNYPNIDLSLSANYKHEKNSYSGLYQKDYQALMDVRLSWTKPISLGTTN